MFLITLTDVFLLLIIIALLGSVVYFSFIKKSNKDKCKGCPYMKDCTKNKNNCH